MNFTALKLELSDRGFAFLSDTRLGNYVNFANHELDDSFLWPYRQTTSSGVPPVSITDLGVVETVYDPTLDCLLPASTYSQVIAETGEVTTTGNPYYWYLGSGGQSVATYPVSTHSIDVRYFKVGPDLSAGSDTPLSPTRFHGLIVDMAVRRAYRDSDNGAAAGDLNAQIDADLMKMANALLSGRVGPAEYVAPVGVDC